MTVDPSIAHEKQRFTRLADALAEKLDRYVGMKGYTNFTGDQLDEISAVEWSLFQLDLQDEGVAYLDSPANSERPWSGLRVLALAVQLFRSGDWADFPTAIKAGEVVTAVNNGSPDENAAFALSIFKGILPELVAYSPEGLGHISGLYMFRRAVMVRRGAELRVREELAQLWSILPTREAVELVIKMTQMGIATDEGALVTVGRMVADGVPMEIAMRSI